MFTYYGQSDKFTDALEILNYIFTVFFVFEAFAQLIGRGFKVYMRDFAIV